MQDAGFRVGVIGALVLFAIWFAGAATASGDPDEPEAPQETESIDDLEGILDGFDDGLEEVVEEEVSESPSWFRLGGLIRSGASYNFAHQAPAAGETDWRGLSRLRFDLGLEADARLSDSWRLFASGRVSYDAAYAINGRDNYTPEVLDRYEHEAELEDTFVVGRLGRQFDLKLGRQIVAWGTSETIRVTDIINPLDLREPGLTDIDDLRLPVAMTRLDVGAGPWELTGVAIHEVRVNKTPVYGHDFYPFGIPLPEATVPSSSLENTQFAAAARGAFKGWDLSLHWAEIYDQTPHLSYDPAAGFQLTHSRLSMLGATWDMAVGDTVLKAEAAHLRGLEFFAAPGEQFSRTDVLSGVEYSGFTDTMLVLEAVHRHLHDFRPELGLGPGPARENEVDWALRVSRMLLHQTLTLTLVALSFELDGDGGGLQRLEARYDLSDTVEITGGLVLYQSGDRPGFESVDDNDRLFLEVEWRF